MTLPRQAVMRERPSTYGAGWICGDPQDYDREYCVDLAQLSAFLHDTQRRAARSRWTWARTARRGASSWPGCKGEVTKRGTIDVLRKGVKHGPHQIDLMYGTPSPGNEKAIARYGQNRFSVTRQLRYSLRREAARPRPVPLCQRPARRHLRAEEQPDQADGG